LALAGSDLASFDGKAECSGHFDIVLSLKIFAIVAVPLYRKLSQMKMITGYKKSIKSFLALLAPTFGC
jgi:hypothetical protein